MAEHTIDDFELHQNVASGTTTQIWEVSRVGEAERLAMKLLNNEAMQDREQVASLRHEAKVARSLDHPNVIQFFGFHADRNHAYMLLELFRAPNTKSWVKSDLLGLQQRLPRLIESTCLALAHMHEHGWIHKDLKPDNLLMNRGSEVRLIDFALSVRVQSGLGKFLGGKPKSIQGTRSYIAPETLRKQPSTTATDVYSFGIMLFEFLTGEVPFVGSTPQDLLKKHVGEPPPPPSARNPNVTPEVDQIILRMLSKKPDRRHQTLEEVFSDLRSVSLFREALTEKVESDEEEVDDGLSGRLNSRADAARSAAGRTEAAAESRSEAPAEPRAGGPQPSRPPAPARPPSPPPAQAPAAQQQPPQPPGGQPAPAQHPPTPGGQVPAGQQPYPYPPQQYPGYPYPAYPYPPQPGQPPPFYPHGQPAPPPWGQPPPGAPGPPPAPGQPPANVPPPGESAPPAQSPPPTASGPPAPSGGQAPRRDADSRPAPPAAAPQSSPPAADERRQAAPDSGEEESEDLPFMTELPDVE